EANGIIRDPSAVGVPVPVSVIPNNPNTTPNNNNSTSNGGGGGAFNYLTLALLWLLSLTRRRGL
ncbi:MAG: hypothetical protein ACE5EH_12335, partial [Gammaproteobacteria bacterium]